MSITSVINDTVTSVSLVNAQKPLPPTISGYSVGGLDDTALDPAGGQTVQINGTGFLPGATITFDGSAVAVVTFSSANRLTFTSPAKSAGTYTIYVVNPDGGTAIYIPGVIYSNLPTWTTGAGTLGSYYETTSISNTVVASGDAPITYSLYSGSLPTGSTLSSGGVITGTAPVDNSSTTYSFTIEAIDAQLQSSTRSFSLTINTDVVTWVSPANATTYTSAVDSAIANVTLSATDAAGYAVTYTANALPTGLSLSGANISGTPTVIADSSTLLTATAATTNRTATRTINWSITVANDPYFEYNTLLIPGASTTFVDDASTNNFAVTINGDTKPNSMNPYSPGYYSNYFDGTGDYLTLPDNTAFDFPGDFTVEAWVYLNTVTGSQGVYSSIDNGADSWVGVTLSFSGTSFLATSYISGNDTITHQTAVTAGQWYHIAIVRNGSSTKSYLNGVQSTTTTSGTYSLTQSGGTIGSAYPGSSPLNGYISNLRVVKGTAVYTSSFTPSTAPLTAISGTSLLTCQSNRFIDNSTNAFTITVTGDTSIKSFQPFTPNNSYSTYGSGYFDGLGDWLTLPNNAGFAFGSGAFTVEMWVYITGSSGTVANYSNGQSSNSNFAWELYQVNTTTMQFSVFEGATQYISSSTSFKQNTWNHIACVRSSNTLTTYVNGVAGATTANITGVTISDPASATLKICSYGNGSSYVTGYITDLRVVKGTAVYTTAFTPPTTPLTAIANTSLLTLQNNQSVNNNVFLDNSSNNFLVTRAGNSTQGTFSPYGGNWSNYFDGSGDYLTLPNNAVFSQTGSWTLELWVYPTVAVNNYVYSQATANFLQINIDGANYVNIDRSGVGNLIVSTNPILLNTWTHIALVSDGTNMKLFINGTQSGSTAAVGTQASSATTTRIGAYQATGSLAYQGYISNLRLVKGSALYTTTFTPSTTPLTAVNGTGLLTCQSNSLIDTSINNFTITKNGDTSVQRFSPFNPASLTPISYSGYFDGSGDYLSVASNAVFGFGTGDFTIEFWAYSTSSARQDWIDISDGTNRVLFYYTGSAVTFYGNGSAVITGSAITLNTWVHYALSKSSGSTKMFVNGVQAGSTYATSQNYGTTASVSIGKDMFGSTYVTGYMSNIRIVKGTAVYTSNFTPSTTPLTAIANTSLLTCQSTTFIDNSTNNFTITANGNSQPSIQNPFGYTSTTTNGYSVSTIGGSGYFDGTGDYLTMPTNSVFSISGAFTFETWLYPTAFSNYKGIWSNTNTINSTGLHVGLNAAGNIFIYSNSSFVVTSSNAMTLNAWNHVAVVRNSGVVYIYINGVVSTTSWTTSTAFTNAACVIGTNPGPGTEYYFGYLSDARLLNGTALYTSNFVPPSQPLTAVQNTSLLTNMTSAGIYDASMMTTMETLGDAKLSTTVTKFGGSSVSFDGTGDYLKAPYNSAYSLPGDFTVETWIYLTSAAGTGNQTIVSYQYNNSDATGVWGFYLNGSGPYTLYFNTQGTNHASTTTVAIPVNTWTHITYCRSGSTGRFFVNGTIVGSSVSDSSTYSSTTGSLFVGIMADGGSSPLYGYIDDLRITKGYARYTTNFTAPTSAFPIY